MKGLLLSSDMKKNKLQQNETETNYSNDAE